MDTIKPDKHYLNYQLEDLEGEEWIDVLGYDGIYLVSNFGRIKSYEREINMGKRGVRIQPERIMKQYISMSNPNNIKSPSKELHITFCVDRVNKGFCVTSLVGNAFVGIKKESEVFSKKDKIWYNTKVDNLEIKTVSECFVIAYEKGNNLRKKKHLTINHKNLFIYIRQKDGKEFNAQELLSEYRKEIRSNLRKAVRKNSIAYGSKWSRRQVIYN